MRGICDLILQVLLFIERADDADAMQPLAHNVVLDINIFVGFPVQRVDGFTDGQHNHEHQRHKRQQNE